MFKQPDQWGPVPDRGDIEKFGDAVRELGRVVWEEIEKKLTPIVAWLSRRL